MLRQVLRLPLLVILAGIVCAAMLVPAAHAAAVRDWPVARAFLWSGLGGLTVSTFIGIASHPFVPSRLSRSRLIALIVAFAGLPVILAVPVMETVPGIGLGAAYFEMVSSLTTTGATLFDDPGAVPPSVHLWRALAGWMGGFFMWIVAVAVFQPLNLGGFEVLSGAPGQGVSVGPIVRVADPAERMARFGAALFPVYAGLTGVLWVTLLMAGDSNLVALCHAMSTMATSGISPLPGLGGSGSGVTGEALILLFLGFALSRRTFAGRNQGGGLPALWRDREFRLGLIIVALVTLLLFLRHWLGAYEITVESDAATAGAALWGDLFTVASFLTTTGFVSQEWLTARSWSGLETPGLVLMGLALIGGGVATTAGGVKLLRVYALWKHGERELEKLIEPHSVGGSGAVARHLRREGAQIAWIFFMLFTLSIAVVMLALASVGIPFYETIVLAIAALSNTGPVALIAGPEPLSYASLGEGARLILAAAMVLGRVETLAVVALMNPEFWRR